LNGTTGERVGERPVYKATSAGTSTDGLNYTAGAVTKVVHTGALTMAGTLAKAGTLSIVLTSTTLATATLTLTDGSKTTFTGVAAAGTKNITFTDTALTGGAGTGTFVITSDAAFAKDDGLSFAVSRAFTPVAAMASNDVQINGVTIGASYASDDKFSPAASAAASAAAINLATSATGVAAVVNANVMSGSAMGTNLASATGTVTINGFTSASITTAANNTRESRAAVVSAINAISAQTGVVAIDNINDTQGIRLEAANGRNIEVAFNSLGSSSGGYLFTGNLGGRKAESHHRVDGRLDPRGTQACRLHSQPSGHQQWRAARGYRRWQHQDAGRGRLVYQWRRYSCNDPE
jgi:flagellin